MKSVSTALRPIHVVFALLFGFSAAPLHAGVVHDVAPLRYSFSQVQQKEISRDQAAAKVKRRYGGKILAISEVNRNGRSMYRIKGLSDKSQVYVVYVDKRTGSISR